MKFTSLCLPAVLLWATLLSAARAEDRTVYVGSKAFTESVILGETLAHLVRDVGVPVDHKSEMGTRVVFEGLRTGEIDIYPEYTGTITAELFPHDGLRNDDDIRAKLKEMGIGMTARLGFSDNYALGIKRSRAEKLGLRRISDLAGRDASVRGLKLGFSDEFMHRRDGWRGLQEKYRLPQEPVGMNHNLAYQGLEQGVLDITDLFTTDAEIRSFDLVVLEDDQGYFPVYHCVILYRLDLAAKSASALAAIKRLEGAIDNQAMIEMNARARVDRVSETRVAAEFLKTRLNIEVPLPADRLVVRIANDLVRNTWRHLLLVSVSLLAAVLAAVPLGVIAAKSPSLGQPILGVVGIIQTIPSMAVLALMIPLLGLGMKPAICALFLYSLLPIVRGTYAGLKEIPGNLLESAVVLGLPPAARLRLVELPLASRSILSGIKTAAVINVGMATIGALIGAGGYGEPIMTGIRLADVSLLLQGAVPAAAMAVVVQGLFELAELRLVPAGLRSGKK